MKRWVVSAVLLSVLLLSGCVSQKKYDALAAERDSLAAECEELRTTVETLRGQIGELETSAEELRAYIAGQTDEINELRDALESAKGLSKQQQETVDELVAALDVLKERTPALPSGEQLHQAVDGAAHSAADTISNLASMVTELFGKLGELSVPSLPGGRK